VIRFPSGHEVKLKPDADAQVVDDPDPAPKTPPTIEKPDLPQQEPTGQVKRTVIDLDQDPPDD
jgi:hypothetical protein